MAEGKEEIDLEKQQAQEVESQWWRDPQCVSRAVSGWNSIWGHVGWSLTASQPSETDSSPSRPASTMDHTVQVEGTDPASSSEPTCQG